MKTNYMKGSMLLIGMLMLGITANAQKNDTVKRKFYADRYSNSYRVINSTPGHVREHITTNWNGKYYEMMLLNDKVTEFYVEGEKIPESKWGEYKDVIAGIREQLRKDKIQAKKDMEQARRDQEQAKRDQKQAVLDQMQAKKDQEQAKRDLDQAVRDQVQAKIDQEKAMAEAKRDMEQAKLDQEQAQRDQAQAKLDQEQAQRDQVQAKHDQEEAKEDQRQLKLLITDLVNDKIVPDEKSLRDLTLDQDEMTVNGVKQPDEVFKKYRDKYPRFSHGHFSYGDEGNGSIHMSRHSTSDN
jgi:hypothetical protein